MSLLSPSHAVLGVCGDDGQDERIRHAVVNSGGAYTRCMCPTSIAKHLVTGTRQDVMVVAADGKNLELILSSLVVMGKQYGRIPIIAISADDEIIGDERLQWIKPDFEPHQLEGAISTALSRRPLQQA